jgi:hypothetical protein
VSVVVHLKCGGCEAEADTKPIRAEYVPLFTNSLFCRTRYPVVTNDLAPEGWVIFDPYTLATYCPECWASIVDEDGALVAVPE